MDRVSLRRATEEDFDFICQIHKSNFYSLLEAQVGWDDELEREQLSYIFRPGNDLIVVWRGNDVGYLSYEVENDVLHIKQLELHPDYHRQGIGSQVIVGMRFSHGLPMTLAVAKNNLAAISFFEQVGFASESERTITKQGKERTAAISHLVMNIAQV
ncbi:GNAT family N-acetyltransferase [Caldalkalibacillus salinus]|uniref:GNAT family N-acetyltransferase n=1 Tax=Caldalkalibacillus salinus TaxID=2803787 RepID=UPI001920C113|nr:N-acetyltransferase [Caldalkalibacillus salinus]